MKSMRKKQPFLDGFDSLSDPGNLKSHDIMKAYSQFMNLSVGCRPRFSSSIRPSENIRAGRLHRPQDVDGQGASSQSAVGVFSAKLLRFAVTPHTARLLLKCGNAGTKLVYCSVHPADSYSPGSLPVCAKSVSHNLAACCDGRQQYFFFVEALRAGLQALVKQVIILTDEFLKLLSHRTQCPVSGIECDRCGEKCSERAERTTGKTQPIRTASFLGHVNDRRDVQRKAEKRYGRAGAECHGHQGRNGQSCAHRFKLPKFNRLVEGDR